MNDKLHIGKTNRKELRCATCGCKDEHKPITQSDDFLECSICLEWCHKEDMWIEVEIGSYNSNWRDFA